MRLLGFYGDRKMHMTITRIALFAATLLTCDFAAAQTEPPAPHNNAIVYKCTGANGSVAFSSAPCSDAQATQKVMDTSAALRTDSGGNSVEPSANGAEPDCRARAKQTAYAGVSAQIEESNRHIADYQQSLNELAAQRSNADGSGKPIDDPIARQTRDKINEALAQERLFKHNAQANADSAYADGLKVCDEEAAKKAQPRADAEVK